MTRKFTQAGTGAILRALGSRGTWIPVNPPTASHNGTARQIVVGAMRFDIIELADAFQQGVTFNHVPIPDEWEVVSDPWIVWTWRQGIAPVLGDVRWQVMYLPVRNLTALAEGAGSPKAVTASATGPASQNVELAFLQIDRADLANRDHLIFSIERLGAHLGDTLLNTVELLTVTMWWPLAP